MEKPSGAQPARNADTAIKMMVTIAKRLAADRRSPPATGCNSAAPLALILLLSLGRFAGAELLQIVFRLVQRNGAAAETDAEASPFGVSVDEIRLALLEAV